VTRGRLLGAGLAAYLLALLFTVPAELLRGPLQTTLPEVRLGALSGHAHAGRVEPLSVAGVALDRAAWRWRPSALLSGRLGFEVTVDTGSGQVALRAARAPGSDLLELEAVRGSLDLDWLGRALPRQPVRARGRLLLEELAVDLDPSGWPRRARGRFRLQQAVLSAPVALNLADVDGTLGMEGGRLVVDFTLAPAAALTGSGRLQLAADGGYRIAARLAPGAAAAPDVTGWLRQAGRPAADGSVQVDLAGRLR
jgi:general secretion pathway protein N